MKYLPAWVRRFWSSYSIRNKIFLSTLGIILISSLIIIGISTVQYKEEAKDYNIKRLARKERAILASINMVLRRTTFPVTTENLPLIFKKEIHNISAIHNMHIEIYDLQGHYLVGSATGFGRDTIYQMIPPHLLDSLNNSPEKKIRIEDKTVNGKFISSYSYLTDLRFKPIGIVHILYKSKLDFYENEMSEFIKRLGSVYFFLILLSVFVSYYLSRLLTRSLKVVSERIDQTDIENNPVSLQLHTSTLPEELKPIVEAYNLMLSKLADSRRRLMQAERESAWKEMARQIAHEIKNPLTPMQLSVEHFVQTFDPQAPDAREQLEEFRSIMIDQINALNRIAASFSDFTRIGELHTETFDLVELIQTTAGLFPGLVKVESKIDTLPFAGDKTKIKQALINLIKNAKQAQTGQSDAFVHIELSVSNDRIRIAVIDNGPGIPPDNMDRIFQPKFTTKSSGTGLGLAIVKRIIESHGGQIRIENRQPHGAVFIIILPKNPK